MASIPEQIIAYVQGALNLATVTWTSGGGTPFTLGLIVTGQTSRATGIIALSYGGELTSGSLQLNTVSGTFLVGETITDTATGSATIATSAQSAVPVLIGRRATEEALAPPSVVAVPLGAPEIVQPDRPGSDITNNGAINSGNPARILYLRRFDIEWWCHNAPTMPALAPDFTLAEQLYLQVITTIRQLTHNSCRFRNEEWLDQQQGDDSFERFGTTIKFISTIQVPLYETSPAVVVLTGVEATVTEGTESVVINQ